MEFNAFRAGSLTALFIVLMVLRHDLELKIRVLLSIFYLDGLFGLFLTGSNGLFVMYLYGQSPSKDIVPWYVGTKRTRM